MSDIVASDIVLIEKAGRPT